MEMRIKEQKVFMGKFFSVEDTAKALEAIGSAQKIVFVDTPSTEHMVSCIEQLTKNGVEVVVRDHHDVASPRNEREEAIARAANRVREIASDAIIKTRDEHPACSSLINVGEFADVDIIVADPDPDGLTAAMKALGVMYPELDSDAAILDGPRTNQTAKGGLSPLAVLLVKGMATLPPFNQKNPQASEKAKGELFSTFIGAVQGDSEAKASLETKVEAYEAGVAVAKELASKATEIVPHIVLVDVVGAKRFDLGTLTRNLESREGCKVTVTRKDSGPIAGSHGVQYSLAVVKQFQEEINLQDLLPSGFESSPKAGIISNTSFLLHVSEEIWEKEVLPRLQK